MVNQKIQKQIKKKKQKIMKDFSNAICFSVTKFMTDYA